MIPVSVAQATGLVGGRACDIPPAVEVQYLRSVATDSRLVEPGSLFVAIRGERVDGHDYVPQALSAGALAALVSQPVTGPSILVQDTVASMGSLAAALRQRLAGCRVVAITGSSGKTSTKDLLAEVLGSHGPTVAPQGSFNTEVGVPMTIFRAELGTKYLVLEMGMRGPGHISTLVQLARPEIGVILNAGSAHLGMMGSRQAIVEAKGEILDLLPSEGFAVLPGDDPAILAQVRRTSASILTFGTGPSLDVRAEHVRMDEAARPSFDMVWAERRTEVRLQSRGRHQVANALAAAAVCLGLGLDQDWTAAALSAATPRSQWRMEVHRAPSGVTVVNDAYNANPESVAAALATLVAMGEGRRRIAVLGEMLELGAASPALHAEVGQQAATLGIRLVCVGPGTVPMHQAAIAAGGSSHWVPDAQEAIESVLADLGAGDTVLVKASRGIGLEQVALGLIEASPAAAGQVSGGSSAIGGPGAFGGSVEVRGSA